MLLKEPFNFFFFSLFHIFNLDLFFFVHFTGFQMDLLSFDIGPSDAQATSIYSTVIAIISLSVADL